MLPVPVLRAMRRLEDAEYEVFAVGGCVRDILLQKTPQDWDLTTAAQPQQIIECFADCKQILTGLKHGTVTVLMDNEPIEITTYRTDGAYLDHRRPESVCFTSSLKEDLARRDFTVNAMAMDKDGVIYDFFNGKEDLAQKKIRCVGDAQKRFEEDALRILRGLRFASLEGFSLDEHTLTAANALAKNLTYIARERIAAELKKMLCLPGAAAILLQTHAIFSVLFPTLSCTKEQWECVCAYIQACGGRLELAFAFLLLHTDFKRELSLLKIENALKRNIQMLLENQTVPLKNEKTALALTMCRLGRESTHLLLEFFICSGRFDASVRQTAALAANGCCSLAQLQIRGEDVMAAGYKKREIKTALENLLAAVVQEKCENNRESLLAFLKKNNILLKNSKY